MSNDITQLPSTISDTIRDFFLIIGVSFFLIILGHYAIGGARYVKHLVTGVKSNETILRETKQSPVFAGYANYDTYFEEAAQLKLQVLPYYHWRKMPFQGNSIQIDNHLIRKTIKNPHPLAKKVFLFGGSTLWGTGVPDQYTIPSLVQTLLGPGYDVYNFGETAFVSAQELNLLLEQLSNGFIPDLVIFYDGANDTYAGLYAPGRPRHPQFRGEDYQSKEELSYLINKIIEKTNYIALTERYKIWRKKDLQSVWDQNIAPNLEKNALETIKHYSHFIKQVNALGKAYGFEVHYFWQPTLILGNKPLAASEQEILATTSPALVSSYQQMYKMAKTELQKEKNFHYIAEIFNETTEPLYFDCHHMGPKGNQLVAEAIVKQAFS